MFLRGREGVKRSDESRFKALLNRKVVAEPAGNRELPIGDRKDATEEKQVPGICGLNVSPQWCRRRWKDQPEFANARTRTARDPLITTWRRHGLLHRCGCFRRSPGVPIANRAGHPRFPRFEPIEE